MTRRDLRLLAILALLLAVQLAPVLVTGRTWFLRDLTFINHPWRALAAGMVQSGTFPLWDPYAYCGMPLAANMQSQVLYPLGTAFQLFSFTTALKLFHCLHFALAGSLCFLWLRSWRLGRAGAALAAACWMLGGATMSRLEFPNFLSVLALAPGMMLLARSRAGLALALALGLLAGHPQVWAVAGASAFVMCVLSRRGQGWAGELLRWIQALGLALVSTACLALPAAELIRDSRRLEGLEATVQLAHSLGWADWLGLATAIATAPDPAGARYAWWAAIYVGGAACVAAAFGVAGLGRRGLAWAALAAAPALLTLGGNWAPVTWLWERLPGLGLIRYPSNLAFAAVFALLPLVALGMGRMRWAPLVALAGALELLAYGAGFHPTAPAAYWHDKGPAVGLLEARLEGHRFFLSPRAERDQLGRGHTREEALLDIKHRLHGLSNLPFRLAAVGGAGEPLVPANTERVLSALKSRRGAKEAAVALSWLDGRLLLVPEPLAEPGELVPLGRPLWQAYEAPRAGRAFVVADPASLAVPFEGLGPPPPPAAFLQSREDSETALGEGAGWAVISRPLTAGWKAWVNGRPAEPALAFGVFPAYPVPAGTWVLSTRYRPLTWAAGLALTLCFLSAAGLYLYNAVRAGARAH